LRSDSMRDRSRSRTADYQWSKPVYVTSWPCRGRCGALVPITQDAIDRAEIFDRRLAEVGDENGNREPIDRARIVFCDACRDAGRKMAPENKRRHVDAMALLIRELRGGTTNPDPPGPAPSPAREAEIIQKLRAMKHPDVDALVQTIREKRNQGGSGKPKRKL